MWCGPLLGFVKKKKKKEVSHFADSEKALQLHSEKRKEAAGKNYAEAILFFTLQNQLWKTENIQ